MSEQCHCGQPIYINDDIEPGWTRGLCRECDIARCDAPAEGVRYPCLSLTFPECYEHPGLVELMNDNLNRGD